MAQMKRFNLFMESELIADLNAFAKQEHVSASSVMRYALRKYLKDRQHPLASGRSALPTPVDASAINDA